MGLIMLLAIGAYLLWNEVEDLAADFNLHFMAEAGRLEAYQLSPLRIKILALSRFTRWAALVGIAFVFSLGVALGVFVAGFVVAIILAPLANITRPLAWTSLPVSIPIAATLTIAALVAAA